MKALLATTAFCALLLSQAAWAQQEQPRSTTPSRVEQAPTSNPPADPHKDGGRPETHGGAVNQLSTDHDCPQTTTHLWKQEGNPAECSCYVLGPIDTPLPSRTTTPTGGDPGEMGQLGTAALAAGRRGAAQAGDGIDVNGAGVAPDGAVNTGRRCPS